VVDSSTCPEAGSGLVIPDLDVAAEMFAAIALEAAVPAMAVYAADKILVHRKPDQSPVSEADELAEAVILARLAQLLPGLPVLSEEAAAGGEGGAVGSTFVLVDPIDGTKEFLSHNGEFTINIGLVVAGQPRAGVVYAPALGKLWIGGTSATACDVAFGTALPPARERAPIHVRRAPPGGLTAVVSRSHSDPATEAFLARLEIADRHAAGSSLKFCAIAEGNADVYPRLGPTMEWDTAAGDAVLRAAGGFVQGEDGAPLRYGKAEAGFRNDRFIAWGDAFFAREGVSSILR
jgi:3'(2'), 5'-bisphosphate nucleotidase